MTSLVLGARDHPGGVSRPLLSCLGWQVAGLLLIACHVYLTAALGQALLSFLIIMPLVVLLYALEPMGGFIVILQALLYENVIISTAGASLDVGLFHLLEGTSFVLLFAAAGVAVVRLLLPDGSRRSRAIMQLLAAAMVIAVYAAIGVERAGFMAAAIYFRSASVGLIAAVIGLDLGFRYGYGAVVRNFLICLALGLVLTIFEITMTDAYYDLIDAKDYSTLQYMSIGTPLVFYSAADVVAKLTSGFFNVSSLGTSFRFNGPNMHSVSYAYVLAIAGIAAMTIGWRWLLLGVFPLLLLIGVKGALVLAVAALVLWGFGCWFGLKPLCAAILLYAGAYTAALVIYGLSIGDYHIIGLLGGVNGFLSNPLGHGLGVGGNLGSDQASAWTWSDLQLYGANEGLESAIGVLLYQMGIGTLAFGYIIWRIGAPLVRSVADPNFVPLSLLGVALCVIVVNGCFQEEAFSPYALGLLILLGSAALVEIPGAP